MLVVVMATRILVITLVAAAIAHVALIFSLNPVVLLIVCAIKLAAIRLSHVPP